MCKRITAFLLTTLLALAAACPALANMAAPRPSDVGTTVTFEKNQDIAVTAETLDIRVEGAKAQIRAEYTMKNTAGEQVSTPAMFLCPDQEEGSVRVTAREEPLEFRVEEYALSYDSRVETESWEYAVLSSGEAASPNRETVWAISFQLDFDPQEEYVVSVEYTYALGGYPEYDFDVKDGRIQYYLLPAAGWKDFGSLTINLYLDKDMPVIASSSLPFEKVGSRTYQYVSRGLPEEDLSITIEENGFQKIFSTLRSPYLRMTLLLFAPFVLVAAGVVLLVVLIRRKRKTK